MDAWRIIDWIMDEMKRRGWNPVIMHKNTGVSESCIRYAQNKQGMLRLDTLVTILDALGYEINIIKKEGDLNALGSEGNS